MDCLSGLANSICGTAGAAVSGKSLKSGQYMHQFVDNRKPIRVAITGVGGQIGYALLPMIASGSMFGPDVKVVIQGLDLDVPAVKENLAGIQMELEDGDYPLLEKVIFSTDPAVAFQDCDVAVLLGAFPRKQGMERKELMEKNIMIFKTMGQAIEAKASRDVKVLIVGNPANTNCLVCSKYAPSIPKKNFTALTRLDHNRAAAQLAKMLDVNVSKIKDVIIWGNHSSTQYPDVSHAKIDGKPMEQTLVKSGLAGWVTGDFISTIQKRGAAIINARKASSALSAARAITHHVHDWLLGSKGEIISMGVHSAVDKTAANYMGEEDIIFSLPVKCEGDGNFVVVPNLEISEFSRKKIEETEAELVDERKLALSLIA